MISALNTPHTKGLIEAGVKPTILSCAESPFIATNFYINLKKISQPYKHSFVYSGMKKQLNKNIIYHQMFLPQPFDYKDYPLVDFKNKLFLVAITSAKSVNRLKSFIKSLVLKFFYSWSVKEIYLERRNAINYFSVQAGFDLFGYGWDKVKANDLSKEAVENCYRGTVDDKLAVLNKYRFALCFENAIFPGYVTEKIFDALIAGCVPIYYGALDINDFVPANCFINRRDFGNYRDLHDYLLKIDENKFNEYLNNIRKFLDSDNYEKFTQEYNAKQILNILEKEF
jgi:hypothetical protein